MSSHHVRKHVVVAVVAESNDQCCQMPFVVVEVIVVYVVE